MKLIGSENSFTNEEKEKIIFHLVKNLSIIDKSYYIKKTQGYFIEKESDRNSFLLYINIDKKLCYIQSIEYNNSTYEN